MKISVEISYYPLRQEYRQPISEFLTRLSQHPSLEVEYGKMSSFIFGDYGVIMPLLEAEMGKTLRVIPKSVFVIKLSGGCH
ncbi:hypothetical protein [Thiomicrorhabdus sp. Milos-T2]|uniref:hypothetical protein n=1 Tax=Thiomicrorhabdus sp. Milos-T2 TaxID=90814 RepID=UPI000493EA8A|nr:hypothetical protein [Thiomicrorhabdus sp. Milos-T2]